MVILRPLASDNVPLWVVPQTEESDWHGRSASLQASSEHAVDRVEEFQTRLSLVDCLDLNGNSFRELELLTSSKNILDLEDGCVDVRLLGFGVSLVARPAINVLGTDNSVRIQAELDS